MPPSPLRPHGSARRDRARRRDRRRGGPGPGASRDPLVRGWAITRLLAMGATSPLWGPVVAARAAVNHARATRLSAEFADQLDLIAAGHDPRGPANRTTRIDADRRIVVWSDLHRNIAGPLDWPGRQGTTPIAEAMLDHYAAEEWTLVENGDVEDFWMVGGTAEGAIYDAERVVGAALAALGSHALLDRTYRHQLDSIIEHNEGVYRRIREGFGRHGRYLRIVGNHDDPIDRPAVLERLAEATGGASPCDYVVVERDGRPEAVITHGHHTDGWNAPRRDQLGKFATWLGSMLRDVGLPEPGGPPPPESGRRLLDGLATNRLIPVHPIFGASANFDTMDEELLYAAVGHRADGPWIIMGHTHSPVVAPASRRGGSWARYANSGSGVGHGVVTAVEIDGTAATTTVRLVAWHLDTGTGTAQPTRLELISDGDRLQPG